MRETVIVISDLYVPGTPAPAPLALPGLDLIARFGDCSRLDSGWRDWLARHVGRQDIAQAPVSSVAAAGRTLTSKSVWMATPLHLAAGLTTLHFDARGILQLSAHELAQLALDFQRTFHDASLMPLESGDFLLLRDTLPATITTEPARIVGGKVADALPRGEGASQLRRFGAEIEMWLHGHAVNLARELPISTLWIWGGGAYTPLARSTADALPLAFGSDSYLGGLWQLCGGEARPLPRQLDATYAGSVVLVLESGRMSLSEIDRDFIVPALDALRAHAVERVTILANDRCLALTSSGQRKFWRRARSALETLR